MSALEQRIRLVVADNAQLPGSARTVDREADLYAAGMTSHASVNVMLALENEFDVEFPDRMLRRDVFASVAAIEAALTEIAVDA